MAGAQLREPVSVTLAQLLASIVGTRSDNRR